MKKIYNGLIFMLNTIVLSLIFTSLTRNCIFVLNNSATAVKELTTASRKSIAFFSSGFVSQNSRNSSRPIGCCSTIYLNDNATLTNTDNMKAPSYVPCPTHDNRLSQDCLFICASSFTFIHKKMHNIKETVCRNIRTLCLHELWCYKTSSSNNNTLCIIYIKKTGCWHTGRYLENVESASTSCSCLYVFHPRLSNINAVFTYTHNKRHKSCIIL